MTTEIGKKLVGAVLAGALLAAPVTAHAEEVSPTGKGIVGGGLLGGELVVFGEAIFGVHSGLAYIIGGVVGAGGGAVGGYFIEKASASSDGRVPAYLLAAGVAALVPAIVVTLDATRYRPTEGAREDKPTDLPPSDPGAPGGSSVAVPPGSTPTTTPPPAAPPPPATPGTTPAPAPAGGAQTPGTQSPQAVNRRAPSLVGVRDGELAIGVPVPEVRPIVGSVERQRMGVADRGSELRFPVLNVAF